MPKYRLRATYSTDGITMPDSARFRRRLTRRHLALASVMWVLAGTTHTASAQARASLPALFTAEQATRGREVYAAECASCHGVRLNDGTAVALVGGPFLQKWSHPETTLDDLFYITQTTMPRNRGGSLPAADYEAVLAYLLEQNNYPAGGPSRLTSQTARRDVRLTAASAGDPAPEFIAGSGSAKPSSQGPDQAALNQAAANGAAWLYHTQNYSGTRASPAARITPANASRLQVACAFQMGEVSDFQTGPIVYDGVMYVTTKHVTAAIDAATCRLRWRHVWAPRARDIFTRNRGVALKGGRAFRGTTDGYLIALDAADGRLLWARKVADSLSGETLAMPPLAFEDLVVIGPAVSEFAIKGWIGAFRAEDGTPVWRFNIVPRPGEPGYETWKFESGIPMGGGGVWTAPTLDVEHGQLFVATANPAPDFPVELRGDRNLYTNSLLALDARTGKLLWYDQLVPRDNHDWDMTHASPLIRVTAKGRLRNVVVTVGKDGMLRTVDRETQERLNETPITTRTNVEAPVTTTGTHACPGIFGGAEWNGPAYNSATNLLYVPAVDWCGTYSVSQVVRYIPGASFLGGSYVRDATSQGWITAVDASTGDVKWRYRSTRPMVGAVTTSAGGLVMTGELTGDFLVLDAATGAELYRFNTGGPIGAGVVTYEVAGRQYIAVASGSPSSFWVDRNPGSPTMFVFALPN
jgi:alcohol dehydrogenase (cytochrome c)